MWTNRDQTIARRERHKSLAKIIGGGNMVECKAKTMITCWWAEVREDSGVWGWDYQVLKVGRDDMRDKDNS